MLTAEDVRTGEEVDRQGAEQHENDGLTPELAEHTSINNPEDIREYTGEITPEELKRAYDFLQNSSDSAVEAYAKYLHSTLGNGEPSDARSGLGEMRLAWDGYISGSDKTKKALAGTALGSRESIDLFLEENRKRRLDMRSVLLSTHNLRAAGAFGSQEDVVEPNTATSPVVPAESNGAVSSNGSNGYHEGDNAGREQAVRDALANTMTITPETPTTTNATPAKPEQRRHFWNRWGKKAAISVAAAGTAVALTTSGGNQNQEYDPNAARGGSAPISEPRFPVEQSSTQNPVQGPAMPQEGPMTGELNNSKPSVDIGAPDSVGGITFKPEVNVGVPATDVGAPEASGTNPVVDQSHDTGGQRSEAVGKEDIFVNDVLADITLEAGENTEVRIARRIHEYNQKNGTNIDPGISNAWDLYLADVRRVNGLGPNQPGVPFDIRAQIEQANQKDPTLAARYADLLKQPFTQVQS